MACERVKNRADCVKYKTSAINKVCRSSTRRIVSHTVLLVSYCVSVLYMCCPNGTLLDGRKSLLKLSLQPSLYRCHSALSKLRSVLCYRIARSLTLSMCVPFASVCMRPSCEHFIMASKLSIIWPVFGAG